MSSLSLTEPQVEAMPAEEVLRWAYGEFGTGSVSRAHGRSNPRRSSTSFPSSGSGST